MRIVSVVILAMLFLCPRASADIVTHGVLFGDSFSNDSNDWPAYTEAEFTKFAVTGRYLANVAANFTPQLNSVADYDGIVIMAGINDVFGGSTAADLQGHVNSILSVAPVGTPMFISTLPPAGSHASWNSTKQDVVDTYNDWLRTVPNIYVFDLNQVLDTDGDKNLDAVWDSGDGLHPTTGEANGMGHIARSFNQFNSVPEPSGAAAAVAILFSLGGLRRRRVASSLS